MPKEKGPEKPIQVDENEVLQLQLIEQSLQNMMMQKQAFQMELAEIESSLSELKKLKGEDVFKIVGTLMIKTTKAELVPELEKKRDILNIRLKSIEKQEQEFKERLIKSREEMLKKLRA